MGGALIAVALVDILHHDRAADEGAAATVIDHGKREAGVYGDALVRRLPEPLIGEIGLDGVFGERQAQKTTRCEERMMVNAHGAPRHSRYGRVMAWDEPA